MSKLRNRIMALGLSIVMALTMLPMLGTATFALTESEAAAAESIALDETKSIENQSGYVYFKFTAVESGSYKFWSTGDYDTYAELYSSEDLSNYIMYNDEGGDGNNFKFTYDLKAGETVYLAARPYYADEIISYKVSVTKLEMVDVVFNANGGNFGYDNDEPIETQVQSIEKGSNLYWDYDPFPSDGSDKAFAGWATSADATLPDVDYTTIVTGPMILYAVWNGTCKVTYDANGGELYEYNEGSREQIVGTKFYSPDIAWGDETKKFAGWYDAADNKYDSNSMVTGDLTVQAKWADRIKVTYDANGGYYDNPETTSYIRYQDEGDSFSDGYYPQNADDTKQFDGWYDAAVGGNQVSWQTPITQNMTVYAHWADVVKITYDANGGYLWGNPENKIRTETFRKGSDFTDYSVQWPDETKVFDGWYDQQEGGNRLNWEYRLTNNMTVYARWLDAVVITFDANGGYFYDYSTEAETTTRKQGYHSGTTLLNNGYSTPMNKDSNKAFGGWATTKEATEPDIDYDTTVDSLTTVYAVWKDKVDITYDANGGKISGQATYTDSVAQGSRFNSRYCYWDDDSMLFDGWYTEKTGGTRLNYDTIINEPMTVYAQWKKKITVTYDANGGVFYDTIMSQTREQAVGSHFENNYVRWPDGTKVLRGWYDAKEGGNEITWDTILTEDITVYAHWDDAVIVTFDANGGYFWEDGEQVTTSTQSFKKGGHLNSYDAPSTNDDNVAFGGWASTKDATESNVDYDTVLNEPITVYAVWKPKLTVTYDLQGGTLYGESTYKDTIVSGDRFNDYSDAKWPNSEYYFDGWYDAKEGGKKLNWDNTIITGDITVYAHWKKNLLESFAIEPISLIENTFIDNMMMGYQYDLESALNSGWGNVKIVYDGTEYSGPWNQIRYQLQELIGRYIYIDFETRQSQDPWTVGGTYTATAKIDFLGANCTVPVTIVPSPLTSLAIDDLSIPEFTNGYYNGSTTDPYFYYDLNGDVYLTIVYDGKTYSGTVGEIQTQLEDVYNKQFRNVLNLSLSGDLQNYENRWGKGVHQLTGAVLGQKDDFSVTITDSLITDYTVSDITIEAGTRGSNRSSGNSTYFYYDPAEIMDDMEMMVLYDGVEYYGTFSEIRDQFQFEYGSRANNLLSVNYALTQSSSDIWTPGNTYKITVTLAGISKTFNVTIADSKLTYLKFKDFEIEENTTGSIYGSDKNGYYHYNPLHGEKCQVEAVYDGNKLTGSVDEVFSQIRDLSGYYLDFDQVNDDQSAANPWKAGSTHEVQCRVLGNIYKFNVTITPSKLTAFSIDPFTISEGSSGYMDTDEDGNKFYRYNVGQNYNVKITYNGKIYSGTPSQINETLYNLAGATGTYISFNSNQSEEHWVVGKTYKATATLMGKTCDVNVTIAKSPIKSVTVEDIELIEGYDGYTAYEADVMNGASDYRYNYAPTVTVITTSGETINGRGIRINDEYFQVNVSDDQEKNHWDLGEHEFTVTVGGVSAKGKAKVIESPVKEISVEPIEVFENTNNYFGYNNLKYTVQMKTGAVIEGSGSSFKYNNRHVGMSFTPSSPLSSWKAGETYDVKVSCLGKTGIMQVKYLPSAESIAISDQGEFVLNVKSSDGTTVTANAFNYMPYTKYSKYEHGTLYTDKGQFRIALYGNEEGKNNKVRIGNQTSNTLSSSQWFATNTKAIPFTRMITFAIDNGFANFNGTIDRNNIDQLLRLMLIYRSTNRLSLNILNINYSGLSSIDHIINNPTQLSEADAKAYMKELFNISDVDLTLSSMYNAKDKTVTIPTLGFWNIDRGSIKVFYNSSEQGVTWKDDRSQEERTLIFNNAGKIIKLNGADDVVVDVPVTAIAMDQKTLSVKEGKTGRLSVTFTPSDATNKSLTWKSSDEKVATVNAYGVVTGVGVGTATITAQSVYTAVPAVTSTVTVTHDMVKVEAKAATCTEDGTIEYWNCTGCGKLFKDEAGTQELSKEDIVVKALGHQWGEWKVTKEATETTEGEETRTCSRCKETETRKIPVTTHVHKLVETKAVTAGCETDGNIAYYTCSDCGHIFSDKEGKNEINLEDTVVKALGHNWGEWKVTKEATTTEEGEETRTCSRCKETETRPIPVKEASEWKTPNVDQKFTGVAEKVDGTQYYVVNGEISSTTSAIVEYQGKKYYVINGTVDKNRTAIVQADSLPFVDVHQGDWFYYPVVYVYGYNNANDTKVMSGYSDGIHFGPSDPLARGQFAVMLYRIENEPETAFNPKAFPDVAKGNFYSVPAVWASQNGYITGYNNGNFGPADPITREQLATILYRYAVKKGYNTSVKGDISKFSDQAAVSQFARDALIWANGAGIVTGKADGRIDPQGTTARAECAAMIQRFITFIQR